MESPHTVEGAIALLLVEDDRKLSRMLTQLFSGHGYAVDVAADGQRGLHLALTRTYDVLVLSALGSPVERVAGLDAGADDYLVKPFNLDELLARLGVQVAAVVAAIVVALTGAGVLALIDIQHSAAHNLLQTAIDRADDVVDPPAGTWLITVEGLRQTTTPDLPDGLPATGALARVAATGRSESSESSPSGRHYLIITPQRAARRLGATSATG